MSERMDELTVYIFRYYEHLLTKAEREAHFGINWFEVGGQYGLTPVSVASQSSSSEVRDFDALGKVEFHRRVVERILQEHSAEVILNRCSECEGLCRTPRARQCFRCGHSWYEQKST